MKPRRSRIMLIHALRESQAPAWAAFAAGWPEAEIYNLLDDSLSADLAVEGRLSERMIERFLTLGRYAAKSGSDAILFTCSAFGPAIEAVQQTLPLPVLKPNEAAFEAALDAGTRIGILVSFAPSLAALASEIETMAAARGRKIEIAGGVAEGALAALQAGRGEEHDRIVAQTAAAMTALDALVLGQFSLARAADVIAPLPGRPVFTTPASAVAKLKRLLDA